MKTIALLGPILACTLLFGSTEFFPDLSVRSSGQLVVTQDAAPDDALPHVLTLYGIDPLLSSRCLTADETGLKPIEGVIYNNSGQIDYHRHNPEHLTVGLNGGENAKLIDFGDLRQEGTNISVFDSIARVGRKLVICHAPNDRRAFLDLDSPSLTEGLQNSASTAVELGHIYGGVITNVSKPGLGVATGGSMLILFRPIAHVPGSFVTLRWRVFPLP